MKIKLKTNPKEKERFSVLLLQKSASLLLFLRELKSCELVLRLFQKHKRKKSVFFIQPIYLLSRIM